MDCTYNDLWECAYTMRVHHSHTVFTVILCAPLIFLFHFYNACVTDPHDLVVTCLTAMLEYLRSILIMGSYINHDNQCDIQVRNGLFTLMTVLVNSYLHSLWDSNMSVSLIMITCDVFTVAAYWQADSPDCFARSGGW